jgi:hypothetical protein
MNAEERRLDEGRPRPPFARRAPFAAKDVRRGGDAAERGKSFPRPKPFSPRDERGVKPFSKGKSFPSGDDRSAKPFSKPFPPRGEGNARPFVKDKPFPPRDGRNAKPFAKDRPFAQGKPFAGRDARMPGNARSEGFPARSEARGAPSPRRGPKPFFARDASDRPRSTPPGRAKDYSPREGRAAPASNRAKPSGQARFADKSKPFRPWKDRGAPFDRSSPTAGGERRGATGGGGAFGRGGKPSAPPPGARHPLAARPPRPPFRGKPKGRP